MASNRINFEMPSDVLICFASQRTYSEISENSELSQIAFWFNPSRAFLSCNAEKAAESFWR